MMYYLQWVTGKQPEGARIAEFDSEKEALDYVQNFLPNARFSSSWSPNFGTTDQYKRIFNAINATEEEVGKVMEFADVTRELPTTTICPPPRPPKAC